MVMLFVFHETAQDHGALSSSKGEGKRWGRKGMEFDI